MINLLNQIVEVLDKYANLILVIVTAIYAFLTYRIAGIMRKQIIAHIKVSKVSLRVRFTLGRENFNNVSLKELAKKIPSKPKEAVLFFYVSVNFLNLSSGSGTIDHPKLVFKMKKNKFTFKVRPTDERIGKKRGTIHLPGGDFEKVDLEYFIAFNKKNEELFRKLKGHYDKFNFFISYNDNQCKKHLIKIDNIVNNEE